VVSQVVLSFGIPFALVPLLMLSMRKEVMGALVNPKWVSALVAAIVVPIICLNAFLVVRLFVG
jgi:manganese transport protein